MPFELVPSGTHIDFIGRAKLCATLSVLLILGSLAMVPVRGVQLGVDFAGGTEMQVRFANITSSPNELVVNTTFHLEVGAFGADFNICIPYAMIEPIREVLTNTALQKADPEEQKARAERLAGEVKRSHVPLTADFTTIESTIGRLSRLAVGDVLPIELPEEVTARVDDVPVFAAAYGRLNDRKALRVTRMIDHGTQDSPQDA